MRSDQTILSEITQAIRSNLDSWYGTGAELISTEPIREDREFTIFLHYTILDQNRQQVQLILKMPRDSWMTSLDEIIASAHISSFTKQEAAILMRIEEAVKESGNPNLCAIHVLAYLDDYCVTVMEQLPFKTFKQTYLKNPTALQSSDKRRAASQQIQLAGEWLKLYHETFFEGQQASTEELDIMPRINTLLEQLAQLLGAEPETLRQIFDNSYSTIRTELHPLTTLHNDFHLNNVFICQGNQVGGFDPNPDPPDSIYVDLARVLTDCETQQPQVLSSGLYYSPAFILRLKEGFLEGYAAELDANSLNFYCAATVLEKWVRVEQVFADSKLSRIPGAEIPLQFLFQRHFLKLIEGYLTI